MDGYLLKHELYEHDFWSQTLIYCDTKLWLDSCLTYDNRKTYFVFDQKDGRRCDEAVLSAVAAAEERAAAAAAAATANLSSTTLELIAIRKDDDFRKCKLELKYKYKCVHDHMLNDRKLYRPFYNDTKEWPELVNFWNEIEQDYYVLYDTVVVPANVRFDCIAVTNYCTLPLPPHDHRLDYNSDAFSTRKLTPKHVPVGNFDTVQRATVRNVHAECRLSANLLQTVRGLATTH
nr:Caab082 [Calliteara abietis nucleopolyhedrovirus]